MTRRAPCRPAASWLSIQVLGWLAAVYPATAGSFFEYDPDPSAAVIRYQEILGEWEDADDRLSLTIYGDGRGVAHRPRCMKVAGDFSLQLTAADLRLLVQDLVALGLLRFDAGGARQRRQELLAAESPPSEDLPPGIESGGAAFIVSDGSWSIIELNLRQPDASGGPIDFTRTVSWRALRSEAERFPAHAALQDLAAAEARLRTIMAEAIR